MRIKARNDHSHEYTYTYYISHSCFERETKTRAWRRVVQARAKEARLLFTKLNKNIFLTNGPDNMNFYVLLIYY